MPIGYRCRIAHSSAISAIVRSIVKAQSSVGGVRLPVHIADVRFDGVERHHQALMTVAFPCNPFVAFRVSKTILDQSTSCW